MRVIFLFLLFSLVFSFSENMASWNPFGQSYSIFPHQTGKHSCIFIIEKEKFLIFLHCYFWRYEFFLLVGSFSFTNWQIGSQFSLSALFYKYMCLGVSWALYNSRLPSNRIFSWLGEKEAWNK